MEPPTSPQVEEGLDGKKCSDCKKSFKACQCKSCTKCGSIFRRYFGTTLVKGRSHCRVCCAAVCATCHMVINNSFKICTRCHIRQKEEEIDTQKALTAIDNARCGRSDSSLSQTSSDYVFINVAAPASLTPEQIKEALFEAAKKGDHYAMITLLNAKADANSKDASRNTPLFYAAEGGHLPCVALLMERGACVTVVNDSCWTPLHALAWKGATDEHVECAEQLIQMGADVFALTCTQETSADLAERCGGKYELVQLLRAAEVDVAHKQLRRMLRKPSGKDSLLKLHIRAVVRHITRDQEKNWDESDDDSYDDSQDGPDTPELARACKSQELNPGIRTPEKIRREDKTKSLDWAQRKNTTNKELKFETTSMTLGRPFGNNTTSALPRADVEPIIRGDVTAFPPANSSKLEERLRQCESEKSDVEQRCKRLMQAMATAAEAHDQEVTRLQKEIDKINEKMEIALKRCDATYANKISKIRQETDAAVHEANEKANQATKDFNDVLHLQSTYRLTWVPDELVASCSNVKCRTPFTQTRRRHHCRCCGRVFCNNCTDQVAELPLFGYHQPVRMCNPCYALVDDMFTQEQDKT